MMKISLLYYSFRSLRSFSAFFMSVSLAIGFASFLSFSHSASRSGPKKGLLKSLEDLLLTFPIIKYTDMAGPQQMRERLVYEESKTKSSSREGIRASSVTNLPRSFTITATETPLHALVRPVMMNIGKSKNSLFSRHEDDLHSITSSSSMVERIPILCRLCIYNLLWSYSIFIKQNFKKTGRGCLPGVRMGPFNVTNNYIFLKNL